MKVVVSADLVGREEELDRLERLLRTVPDGAVAAVICGGAGIGKTALWRVTAERAEAAGTTVLRSRCAEVEMPIAFGALADLLAAEIADVERTLPPPQLRALTRAFGLTRAEEPTDWLVLASAVLETLRALGLRSPLLLAIDDVQWLDPGSRRVLAWALRRVGAAPVALLATVRGDAEQDPLALADALPAGRFERVEVGPLSAGALQRVIASRVGVHLPRPTLGRVQRASGGNPMFALEFARGVAASGAVAHTGPLAVPASLEQLVSDRVAALPRPLRSLLEFVAALERPTLELLERVLDRRDLEAAVEQATRAELLVVDDGGIVHFAHPLLASAIYFGASRSARRDLHRRLGALVDSIEERARHAALAAAGPDTATATVVFEAASAAAARGALDAAAALADEAARLTPLVEADAKRARILAAAGWLVETGEFEQARSRLDALPSVAQPSARAEELLLRAECELADRRALVALLDNALEVAADPRQRWHALIRLAHQGGWIYGDVPAAAETAQRALDVALELSEEPLVDLSLAALAFYRAALGAEDVGPPRRRAHAGVIPRMQWWLVSPGLSLGSRLLWAGDIERARDILKRTFEADDCAGREAKAGFVLCALAEVEWRAGEWLRAERLARDAAERLGDVNPTAYPRALVAAGRGRVDEARAVANGAIEWAERNDERIAPPRCRWLLGLLELARGEAGAAHALLADAQAGLDACGIREPGYLPVLPDLVESLVMLDRAAEAEPFLARLDVAAAAGNRWAAPAAQRSRALLSLARQDADDAAVLATVAADAFAAIGMPFERGRALVVAGNALRRAGHRRAAGERLAEAIDVFDRIGAPLWLEQADRELGRASPRPGRDPGKLTSAETRVASLVAAGRKNKEIAAELYTTVGTVEAHLTRIYRKLDVRSRAQLVARMAGDASDAGRRQ